MSRHFLQKSTYKKNEIILVNKKKSRANANFKGLFVSWKYSWRKYYAFLSDWFCQKHSYKKKNISWPIANKNLYITRIMNTSPYTTPCFCHNTPIHDSFQPFLHGDLPLSPFALSRHVSPLLQWRGWLKREWRRFHGEVFVSLFKDFTLKRQYFMGLNQ